MKVRATIDRFEGATAVLLQEPDGQPLDLPRAQLPAEAQAGMTLLLEMVEGKVITAVIDDTTTTERHQRIQQKLDRLRRGEHLE